MRTVIVSTLVSVFFALLSVSVLLEASRQPKQAVSDFKQEDPLEKTLAEQLGINQSSAIRGLQRYDDLDYGFTLAVPEGWTKVVADDSEPYDTDELNALLEQGYAIGFESPRLDRHDRFADYILIELLPSDESGLFDATSEEQRFLQVGQERLAYDRLAIDSDSDDHIDVDLVIFQRGVQALGYTLSFYAIGEPANEDKLFEAFQIMLHTYTQNEAPFVIL